jgi:hypothetical protein
MRDVTMAHNGSVLAFFAARWTTVSPSKLFGRTRTNNCFSEKATNSSGRQLATTTTTTTGTLDYFASHCHPAGLADDRVSSWPLSLIYLLDQEWRAPRHNHGLLNYVCARRNTTKSHWSYTY